MPAWAVDVAVVVCFHQQRKLSLIRTVQLKVITPFNGMGCKEHETNCKVIPGNGDAS